MPSGGKTGNKRKADARNPDTTTRRISRHAEGEEEKTGEGACHGLAKLAYADCRG